MLLLRLTGGLAAGYWRQSTIIAVRAPASSCFPRAGSASPATDHHAAPGAEAVSSAELTQAAGHPGLLQSDFPEIPKENRTWPAVFPIYTVTRERRNSPPNQCFGGSVPRKP